MIDKSSVIYIIPYDAAQRHPFCLSFAWKQNSLDIKWALEKMGPAVPIDWQ